MNAGEMNVACLHCGRSYPSSGVPYQCPACGGLYDYIPPWDFGEMRPAPPGLERGASSLGWDLPRISLGEGQTPLIAGRAFGRRVFFKCEYISPTASFKDRGTATLISFLASRGVAEAVEDSSGNAGASFAAYAARAGIRARVYVPEAASMPKRAQIEAYGAEVIVVPGPRSRAAEAARQDAEAGWVYASHAWLPFTLPGYATCACEIVEQLGGAPGAVVLPAGQGGLLLGIGRGFQALLRAGRIARMPMLIGVQASACAPLAALFFRGRRGLELVTEGATIAEGVRVRSPRRAQTVVEITRASGGRFVSVAEPFILPGRDALASLGFYVEPTSALIWHALEETLPILPDPVVAILTGSGYKVREE